MSSFNNGTPVRCMCGDTECPSCGAAQGEFRELCESAKNGYICGDDLCYGGDVTLCGFDKEFYDELCREGKDYEPSEWDEEYPS